MNREELKLKLYREMLRISKWEQKLLWFVDEGKVSGFYHAGRGQEAVAVGACAPLRGSDYIMYDHRGCGHVIAKGVPLAAIFGDFLATTAGTTGGLGAGIVHIAWPELGVLGQSGTLGGSFPIAAGAALSAKRRGTDQVCVCFFGDGTANRGTFLEAANVASLWKLPVIWICENNGYAVSVSVETSTAGGDFIRRAQAFDMYGAQVDGMDAVAVYDAVSQAVDRARSGEGPTFIEAMTYRFRGHYEGDPETYRERVEVDQWRERDPIVALRTAMLDEGSISEVDDLELQKEIDEEVELAAEAAASAPIPDRQRAFEGVYA